MTATECEKCGTVHLAGLCPEDFTEVTYYCPDCNTTYAGVMPKQAIASGRVRANAAGHYDRRCMGCDNRRGW